MFLFTKIRNSLSSRKLNSEIQQEMETSIDSLAALWTSGAIGLSVDPNPRLGSSVPKEIAPAFPDFYAWQHTSHSLSSLALVNQRMVNLVNGTAARRIGAAFVTGSFFHTLDAKPELGRTISQKDDKPGAGNVVVISDALWRQQFSGDPDAIGKTLALNGEKYIVIGVMSKSFGYPFEGDIPYVAPGFRRTDVWRPLALTAAQKTDRTNFDNVDAAIARLRSGISSQQAQGELSALEKQLDVSIPPA